MRLTKSDVLSVIRTEPMAPGNFVLLPEGRSIEASIGSVSDAKFDIIGAIVRTYLPSTRTFMDLNNTCVRLTAGQAMAPYPMELIKIGNYLGALSAHFENVSFYNDDMVDDSVREEMAQFVNVYFPDVIEVDGV